MIKRAPLPVCEFVIIRNAVVRDRRISYLARGILGEVLSRPDNWRITAEQLAATTVPGEGIKSIRRALKELESAGYLKRKRVRSEGGMFTWEHTFYDTPQTGKAAEIGVSAGRTISPKPSDGTPSDGEGRSIEEPIRRTEEEDVLASPVPPSQAQAAATQTNQTGEPENKTVTDDASPINWRDKDRDLFRTLLGDKLTAKAPRWSPAGTYSADTIYKALRSSQKPIRWPGRFVDSIHEANPTSGIDDWLLSQGLEAA